jgi:hypothetical protein
MIDPDFDKNRAAWVANNTSGTSYASKIHTENVPLFPDTPSAPPTLPQVPASSSGGGSGRGSGNGSGRNGSGRTNQKDVQPTQKDSPSMLRSASLPQVGKQLSFSGDARDGIAAVDKKAAARQAEIDAVRDL